MNITTKTVSVNAEHSKSDNDNVVVQQGLDGKENQDCNAGMKLIDC